MAAAAVGLGNLWRFPYLVGENGGAAFIIIYLLAIIAIGIPVMLLEIGAGRMVLGSPVATFRHVHRYATIVGWLIVLLTVVITSYYLVITGWTLGYAVDSLRGEVGQFEEFTSGYASLWYFLAISVMVGLVLIRGLNGVETVARILMPALVLTVVGLAAFSLTLDGWGEAARFMLQPEFGELANPTIWLFAVGQAFYSLAIGQGYLITYGSYLPEGVRLPRAAITVAGTETMIALLAGWMLFPIVFTFGLDPGEGSQLAFNTLPTAFEDMAGGALLAALFFPLFFAAAFSSSIAGMKVIVTTVRDELRLSLTRAVGGSAIVVTLLGIPSALSFSPVELSLFGEPFLEVMDQFGATQVVVTSGIVGAGILSWVVPRERYQEALGRRWLPWARMSIAVGRAIPFVAVIALVYAALT